MTVVRPLFNRKKCCLCNKPTPPLFMFPKDNNRQLVWLKLIGKEDVLQAVDHTYIYNNGRLCVKHFKEEAFNSTLKTKLVKYAVPCRVENRNQDSPAESSDCSFENSSSLPESDCESVKKTNFPSSQIGKNSTGVSSSVTRAASLNKVSEKDSSIADVSSLKFDTTSLNKFTEKTPELCRPMTSVTAPAMVKDPAVTVITLCCTDRKEGTTFHKFLQDPKQRMRWISAVKSKNSRPTHISVLCPKHFNEEQRNNPSALKENRVPNVFALDLLNQQKDIGFFLKGKDDTAADHGEVTIKDDIFELHRNPNEIDKIYVKVMWDESVIKIAKRMQSSQEKSITSDVDARKKMKIDKMCPPSDLPNTSMCSPEKDREINCDELKKGAMCSSSDTNPSNLPTLKHLLLTPTEELLKHLVASKNSQKDTINSPSDVHFSDPLDVPIQSPQTDGEETVSHVDGRENLKKDATCSSSSANNLPNFKHLLQKPAEDHANHVIASKNSEKDIIYSPSDTSLTDPLDLPIQLLQTDGEETVNHVDVRENFKKDAICSSSSANNLPNLKLLLQKPAEDHGNHVIASKNPQKDTIYLPSDANLSDLPNLPLYLSQTDADSRSHVDEWEILKNDEICSFSDNNASTSPKFPMTLPVRAKKKIVLHARKKLKKQAVCYPNTKNEKLVHSLNNSGVKGMGQFSLSVSGNKEKVDSVNSPSGNVSMHYTTGIVTEGRDLIYSSTQTDSAEVTDHDDFIDDIVEGRIDSNNSQLDAEMEERTNAVHFPKIVNVKGGTDPFNLLEDTEIKNFIKAPNEWWTISRTPKYIVCLKLNEDYDPVFKVIIEKDYNVKIFIKGRECTNENRKVSLETISALLQEVDSYEICAGVSDKSMTNCVGHLENGSEGPFSIWCKGCQRKGDEFMNRYKLLNELQ